MSARVAIVDDHALVRAGLRTELSNAGFKIAGEAGDGPEGLALIAAQHPDVAIVDIALPGFDGIELTKRIKAEHPQTRVVVLTMHEIEHDVASAVAAGADAYCVKNSGTETIVAAVRAAADRAHCLAQRRRYTAHRARGADSAAHCRGHEQPGHRGSAGLESGHRKGPRTRHSR